MQTVVVLAGRATFGTGNVSILSEHRHWVDIEQFDAVVQALVVVVILAVRHLFIVLIVLTNRSVGHVVVFGKEMPRRDGIPLEVLCKGRVGLQRLDVGVLAILMTRHGCPEHDDIVGLLMLLHVTDKVAQLIVVTLDAVYV